jgi:hypothetical protein
MVHPKRRLALALAGSWLILAAACADGSSPSEPASTFELQAASRAGLVCADVQAAGTAPLGVIPAGYEGAGSFGGMPGPAFFAGQLGELHSYVTSPLMAVRSNYQGPTHITLVHVFTAPAGTFHTSDTAVCGPLTAQGTCRLSDQMTIVDGTGVFTGAAGKLHNRGVLDFNNLTLTFALKGTICGEGL